MPIGVESDQVQPFFAFGSTSTTTESGGLTATTAHTGSSSDRPTDFDTNEATTTATDDAYFEYVDNARQHDKQLAQFSRFQLDQFVK
jgi:hypothetical protein